MDVAAECLALYKKTPRFWSLFEEEAAGVEPVTLVTPVMDKAMLTVLEATNMEFKTCQQMRCLPALSKLL
jgi:hypothetical protein